MRLLIMSLGLLLSPFASAIASEVVAQCSLVVDGNEVWNGKCCVSADASPDDLNASLHAESWQACLYAKKHPENAKLPTYKQNCFGPWINIFKDDEETSKGDNYSAYWSIEGACHGGGVYSAKKTGNVYQGDKFIFRWHELD
jgi:hypothetical protein